MIYDVRITIYDLLLSRQLTHNHIDATATNRIS